MPFDSPHLYLTIHWAPTGSTLEGGQTGIRFGSALPASQTLVDACASAVQTMWTAVNSKINLDYALKFLRLAQVNTDGKYTPGTFAYDHTYTTTPFGASTGFIRPLQLAAVTSLLTANPRGQAAVGRIYLPPLAADPSTDYRWTASDANGRSGTVATMLIALSSALQGPAIVASRGTKKSAAGKSLPVENVKTGRRPDVQRRRAKAITELYGSTVVARGQV